MKRRDFSTVTSRLERAIADAPRYDGEEHHLRVIQQQIEAIGRGDLDGAIANAHESVRLEIYAPPEFPWIRQAAGIDALRRALAHNFGAMEEQDPEIASLTAQGDTVVLIGRERGRIKGSGAPYRVQFVQRFLFREGRLASVTVIAAHDAAQVRD